MKLIIPIIVMLAVFAGCSAFKENITQEARQTVEYASEDTAALGQRLESLKEILKRLEAYVAEKGKPLLSSANDNNDAAEELLKEVKGQIKQLRADLDQIDKDHKKLVDAYRDLESKWYVKTGRFLTKLFWWFIGLWIVFGVGSAALTAFFPAGGILYGFGKFIIRAMPLANPFSWIRILMGGDSALKAKA